ncbi:MOSC N-terminal beta barrel domain-containing protein [Quadrisphaera oryzae]|uniref:MOSC N-terminal beta barrel domain-containing protein n=1 Tax=Quadrisphaera TaxID=317661 RepID=UPI001647BFC5|nr:MOSC N-terminal beta barrel domain-containing protein [Quadrisphaera sp. RL12-1S]MBC3761910.1 MOSC N-terminal beta barrel domain-containing protein [Quadrisphaera sp. RL12-1S]
MSSSVERGVVVGRVSLLRRFPLRSADGDLPERVAVDAAGLAHDRRWQLVDASGSPLRARDLPELAALTASVDDDDALRVRPTSAGTAAPPLAAGWPERLAGRGARLQDSRAAGAGHAGPHRAGAAVHLVADGAADAPDAPAGCDPGERANVVLDLDPAVAHPGDERGWAGRRLRLGEPGGRPGPLLLVTRTPTRCLGVYADVLEPGPLGLGAVVVLLDR